MEQDKNLEFTEFRTLLTAIRTESIAFKNTILSEDEQKEESEILNEFNGEIQTQAFSTLGNLSTYQSHGWRELVNGWDDGDGGTVSAQSTNGTDE